MFRGNGFPGVDVLVFGIPGATAEDTRRDSVAGRRAVELILSVLCVPRLAASLSRRLETAGEVSKGLGFGVGPTRLQKTANSHKLAVASCSVCFRSLLAFGSAHPSFLLSQALGLLPP